MILWVQTHPAEVLAILGAVAYAARLIVKYNPAPPPGSFIAFVVDVCKFLGTVIPNNPNDPALKQAAEKAVDAKIEEPIQARAVGVIRTVATGKLLEPEPLLGRRRDRSLLRRRFRAIARRNGLDISELDDAAIEEAIHRAEFEHAGQMGGPIKDFFQWVIDNPDKVLAALKLILSLVAAEEVSA